MTSAEEVYSTSDFVVVHTSLFPSTFHLVGAEQFGMMKPTAYIINAARGPIIDEAAMIEALKDGEIAGADWMCLSRSLLQRIILSSIWTM